MSSGFGSSGGGGGGFGFGGGGAGGGEVPPRPSVAPRPGYAWSWDASRGSWQEVWVGGANPPTWLVNPPPGGLPPGAPFWPSQRPPGVDGGGWAAPLTTPQGAPGSFVQGFGGRQWTPHSGPLRTGELRVGGGGGGGGGGGWGSPQIPGQPPFNFGQGAPLPPTSGLPTAAGWGTQPLGHAFGAPPPPGMQGFGASGGRPGPGMSEAGGGGGGYDGYDGSASGNDANNTQYKCKKCGKKFASYDALQQHLEATGHKIKRKRGGMRSKTLRKHRNKRKNTRSKRH